MKKLFTIALLCLSQIGSSQTVFFEDFSTCSNAGVVTSGTGNIAAVAWSTTCPGSVAASDHFQCVGGVLEAQDTNSPEAVWTTGAIDVSSCIGSEVTFDMVDVDNMEDCTDCSGTGSTCVDYVKVEYNLDGTGWQQFGTVTCGLGLTAGNNHIQIGDITGGSTTYTSTCVGYGTSLEIRIACMCWAGDEKWQFDNIAVNCNNCVLSVKIEDFNIKKEERQAKLQWTTKSEFNNNYFAIERSVNGSEYVEIGQVEGAGESSNSIDYEFIDTEINNFKGKTLYYRLKQVDFDTKATYSKIRTMRVPPGKIRFDSQNQEIIIQSDDFNKFDKSYVLNIYDLSGQLQHQSSEQGNTTIPWEKAGFYIIEIPEYNWNEKIVIP